MPDDENANDESTSSESADAVDEILEADVGGGAVGKFLKTLFWIGVISGIAIGATVYYQRQKLAAMSDDEIRLFLAEKLDGRVPGEQLAQIQDAVIAKVRMQPSPGSTSAAVTGTVAYREKIAMPEDAVVIVKLEDSSLQDVAATEIGAQVIESPGSVPVSYSVGFDPDEIIDDHTYTVRATISEGDQLLWTTDAAHQVITNGNPLTADLLLIVVPEPVEP